MHTEEGADAAEQQQSSSRCRSRVQFFTASFPCSRKPLMPFVEGHRGCFCFSVSRARATPPAQLPSSHLALYESQYN